MTSPAVKTVAQKPAPARASSWSDYDPYFPSTKTSSGPQRVTIASGLNRSNSPYFPSLPRATRG